MLKSVNRLVAVVLLATVSPANMRAQPSDELVRFDAAPYIRSQFQQRRATERGETAMPTSQAIEAHLSKPPGAGPFPAVIYLHGCSGLNVASREHFAKMLNAWGYVSLAVDSFATRGIKEDCGHPMPGREADATGALVYLSKLAFVDQGRIAVVGSSEGGIVTLRLAAARDAKVFDVPNDLSFRAAIAFYPLCSAASEQMAIPTLVLIGELDDWTPAKNCERWMQLRNGKGAPVKLVIYPGAYHAFDFPGLKDGMSRLGHWLKYDAEAARQSTEEMHDFLAARLAR
ncbi:dienelactone hydrolase [Bradyrhizobium sp. AZCC 1577]